MPIRVWAAVLAAAAMLSIPLSGSPSAQTAVTPSSDVPPQAAAVLARIKAADSDMLAVSEEDGRMLRLLVASSGAQRALEIGGASGYSAIWTALGLRETGGTLVTIEYDPQRAKALDANIRAAGVSDIVRVIPGDAFAAIPTVTGTFDFVFLDAWKKDYQRFFDLVFPRLDRGGLFVAHNVVNKAREMGDFLRTVRTHPGIVSSIVSPSGEGVSISWKR